MPDIDTTALYESVVFLGYFKDLPDPRQSGKVRYPLDEVLLLCLMAVVAGAKTVSAIAEFGETKLEFLRRFRQFRDGTPAHDHLGDILASLDAAAFQRCFVAWVAALTGAPVEAVAIDGKTLRRSGARRLARCLSTWCRPSLRASGSSSPKSRWTRSRMKSSPFRRCLTC